MWENEKKNEISSLSLIKCRLYSWKGLRIRKEVVVLQSSLKKKLMLLGIWDMYSFST